MTTQTITAEGGEIELTTAESGEITATSADFAVFVVQQVTGGGGGGGVTAYASIGALVTASEGTLAAGYYSADAPTTHPEYPEVLTYWDGVNFLPRDLSPIEDLWDDIAFWVDQEGYFSSDLTRTDVVTASASTVRSWSPGIGSLPWCAQASGGTLSTSILGRSLTCGTPLEVSDGAAARLDVGGYFEIFTVVKLANDTDTNRGITGKWSGSDGWILLASDFSSPNGVLFGFDGVYARAAARLGTVEKVVSGRYTVDGNVYVAVNGVDQGSAVRGVATSNNSAAMVIGAYDISGSTTLQGNIGCVLKINRELTSGERSMVVTAIAKRSGFVA